MANTSKILPVNTTEKIKEAFRNSEVITKAITKATKIAFRQHKLAGNSIAVEQDGKVVLIPASDIPDDVLD
jgi:hypothetical protein